MSRRYKIRGFDKLTAQIFVQYEDLQPICIDLPLKEGNRLPLGEELDTHIKNFLPVWHFDRINQLKSGINESDVAAIESLVEPLEAKKPTEEELSYEIRSRRNEELYKTDWTQLEDSPLLEEQKEAFKSYRQALRDLTDQPNFPQTIKWPKAPFEE